MDERGYSYPPRSGSRYDAGYQQPPAATPLDRAAALMRSSSGYAPTDLSRDRQRPATAVSPLPAHHMDQLTDITAKAAEKLLDLGPIKDQIATLQVADRTNSAHVPIDATS